MVNTVGASTTRIGVRRIVIEVNRDLTVEQLEILDNALKRVGLVKETKVTFHTPRVHKPKQARPTPVRPTMTRPTAHHVFRIGPDNQPSPVPTR